MYWREITGGERQVSWPTTERKNMVPKSQEKGSLTLTLHREINFSWGKRSNIKCCSRKQTGGIGGGGAGI